MGLKPKPPSILDTYRRKKDVYIMPTKRPWKTGEIAIVAPFTIQILNGEIKRQIAINCLVKLLPHRTSAAIDCCLTRIEETIQPRSNQQFSGFIREIRNQLTRLKLSNKSKDQHDHHERIQVCQKQASESSGNHQTGEDPRQSNSNSK